MDKWRNCVNGVAELTKKLDEINRRMNKIDGYENQNRRKEKNGGKESESKRKRKCFEAHRQR